MSGARKLRRFLMAGVFATTFWSNALNAQINYAQPPADDSAPVQAAGVRPELLRDVSLEQKLDAPIPLDLKFRDEKGKSVELRQFFGSKPVILALVYYQCPMLCTEVLNAMTRSLKEISLDMGKDYEVVTVSFDPTDRPIEAEAKRALYTGMYNRAGAQDGWHFLTGEQPQIKALADAVGFHYAFDPISKQYAHPSGIMVLTPEGKLARYFYGVTYPQRDLRLTLVEASAGKIGSPVDAILLYCYHYDPLTGKYGLVISRVIQIAGLLTVLGMAILIFVLFRQENYGSMGRGGQKRGRELHGHV